MFDSNDHTCVDCGEECNCGDFECCVSCSACNDTFDVDRDFGDEDDVYDPRDEDLLWGDD